MVTAAEDSGKRMLSEQVHARLRAAILHGGYAPGQALKPQEIAAAQGTSLAVVREALVRLVGDGLAERLPNRGFAIPECSDRRWQEITEARQTVEPAMLRMAVARGDLEWEVRVRATHHLLSRTPIHAPDEFASDAWSAAHHDFHHALLSGCGNPVLLEQFERLWTASELVRRWSTRRNPRRDFADEHLRLEQAALARDADRAAETLTAHLGLTAAALTDECVGPGPTVTSPAHEHRSRNRR